MQRYRWGHPSIDTFSRRSRWCARRRFGSAQGHVLPRMGFVHLPPLHARHVATPQAPPEATRNPRTTRGLPKEPRDTTMQNDRRRALHVPRPLRRGGGDAAVSSLVIPCCGHPPATRDRARPGACEAEVSCRGCVLRSVGGQSAPRVHEAATLTYSGLFHSVVPLHYDLASHGTFRLSPS